MMLTAKEQRELGAQFLRKAANEIRVRGYTKWVLERLKDSVHQRDRELDPYPIGAVCALGALDKACVKNEKFSSVRKLAENALCKVLPPMDTPRYPSRGEMKFRHALPNHIANWCANHIWYANHIANWSNQMCNSAEEVAMGFEKAAEELEEGRV